MDVTLVMFKSDGTRRDFPLAHQKTLIGRTSQCDLRVPLSSVSREHCEIVIEQQMVVIRDLGSSNGTYHNRRRVQQTTLVAGDEVAIGPVVFTVMIDGQPTHIQPVRVMVGKHHASPRRQGEELAVDEKEDLGVLLEEEAYSPTVDIDESDHDMPPPSRDLEDESPLVDPLNSLSDKPHLPDSEPQRP